jgi:hypothetical protein
MFFNNRILKSPYSVFSTAIFGMNFVILCRCAYFLVNYSIKYCPNGYLSLHEIYK